MVRLTEDVRRQVKRFTDRFRFPGRRSHFQLMFGEFMKAYSLLMRYVPGGRETHLLRHALTQFQNRVRLVDAELPQPTVARSLQLISHQGS